VNAAPPYAIPNDATVYVAGHRGLVGGAITRALQARGLPVRGRTSSQLDLRARGAVDAFFDAERPTNVVLAAAGSFMFCDVRLTRTLAPLLQ